MPKHKKGRKTMMRDRSSSLAVSECSTYSQIPTTTKEHTTTKEPEVEVAEPKLSQESTVDTPIPPSQPDPKKRQKSTNVILSDNDETRVVEWLADHPLMCKKIKEYKETDKKEKLWDELCDELGFTGRHKLNFYLLLLVLGPLYC